MAESSGDPGTVFISYSHRDAAALARLQEHLAPYVRSGAIPLWDDTQIKPGDDWKRGIEQALASARVAVLLVSVSFLASEFVAKEELPKLLAAAEARGTRILPVILTPCLFRRTTLSRFQAVNDPARPLSGLTQHEQDLVWERVVEQVLAVLDAPAATPVPLPVSEPLRPSKTDLRARTRFLANSAKRFRRRPFRDTAIAVALVFTVLAIILGGVATVLINLNASGFQQHVTTDEFIPHIQVGTGFDVQTDSIQGENDTFHPDETVYVAYYLNTLDTHPPFGGGEVILLLLNLSSNQQVVRVPAEIGRGVSTTLYDSMLVKTTGTYEWQITLVGNTSDASITFQVVS